MSETEQRLILTTIQRELWLGPDDEIDDPIPIYRIDTGSYVVRWDMPVLLPKGSRLVLEHRGQTLAVLMEPNPEAPAG